jgi:drug/metabolite transporter (DMT)-like permease
MTTRAEKDDRIASWATLMLVLTTLLWGMSFPWTKRWQNAVDAMGSLEVGTLLASLTLIGVRMPLALLLLGLARPRVVLAPSLREHAGGFVLGSVFFAGFVLQTWGLAWTTPALSAFFTSLCSAWVPLAAWLLFRERLVPLVLAGLVMGLAGCAVLVEGWNLGKGETLTLIASLLFTGQVLLLDRLGRRFEPSHLSAGFLAASAVFGVAGMLLLAAVGPGFAVWTEWTGAILARPRILEAVICLTVMPTVLAFHWMNTYQPLVSPGRAALIYLLEPVFSSIFSVWWGYDQLTVVLVAGGVLILAGNLLAEAPRWRAKKVKELAASGETGG